MPIFLRIWTAIRVLICSPNAQTRARRRGETSLIMLTPCRISPSSVIFSSTSLSAVVGSLRNFVSEHRIAAARNGEKIMRTTPRVWCGAALRHWGSARSHTTQSTRAEHAPSFLGKLAVPFLNPGQRSDLLLAHCFLQTAL